MEFNVEEYLSKRYYWDIEAYIKEHVEPLEKDFAPEHRYTSRYLRTGRDNVFVMVRGDCVCPYPGNYFTIEYVKRRGEEGNCLIAEDLDDSMMGMYNVGTRYEAREWLEDFLKKDLICSMRGLSNHGFVWEN